MQKIKPHLWFDKESKEAARFYCSVFPDSKVLNVSVIKNTPSGDCDIVSFSLWGKEFMAISAGPDFQFNPSISFIVNFDPVFFKGSTEDAIKMLNKVWAKLSKGGNVLMPLDKYPYSDRYGWVQDKYGVTWQLMLTDPKGEQRPTIMPFLMFVNKNAGEAEEAIHYYLRIFRNSKIGMLHRQRDDSSGEKPGTIMFADFMLEGEWFAIMETVREQEYNFNEAISLLVECDSQSEIDHYWQLSAEPSAEQCGWLKDKYGLSWQINPSRMDEMLADPDPARVARVTSAFLKMKKFDIAQLEEAYEG